MRRLGTRQRVLELLSSESSRAAYSIAFVFFFVSGVMRSFVLT